MDNTKTQTAESQAAITPEMALDILKEGNSRFVENRRLARNLNEQTSQTGSGQFPFAAVLGCIDSRVPAELVFDQGIGDIFNVRIAGNFVNSDILGSLEFACKVAGSKAIVVLGHTKCGAVKGACDNVQLGNLTVMLDKLKPALDAVTDEQNDRSSGNATFVQNVADMNVKLAINAIKQQSPVLREMHDNGEIAIVGGMYNVETGRVTYLQD